MFGKRLRELRKEKKLTSKQLGELFNLAESTISGYETGARKPDIETVRSFANYFNVTTDFLLGESNTRDFTMKDERDIARKLESILESMETDTALAFDGEPLDEETKDLVKTAIESNLKLTKQLAKKKFTPKKYRNDQE